MICPVCNRVPSGNLQEHINQCLDQFETVQPQAFECPVCKKDLTAFPILAREQHINDCLETETPCPHCSKMYKRKKEHMKHCLKKMSKQADKKMSLKTRSIVYEKPISDDDFEPELVRETVRELKPSEDEDLKTAIGLSLSLDSHQKSTRKKLMSLGGIIFQDAFDPKLPTSCLLPAEEAIALVQQKKQSFNAEIQTPKIQHPKLKKEIRFLGNQQQETKTLWEDAGTPVLVKKPLKFLAKYHLSPNPETPVVPRVVPEVDLPETDPDSRLDLAETTEPMEEPVKEPVIKEAAPTAKESEVTDVEDELQQTETNGQDLTKRHQKEMAAQKEQHQRQLKQLQAALSRQHQVQMDQMKRDYEQELLKLKTTITNLEQQLEDYKMSKSAAVRVPIEPSRPLDLATRADFSGTVNPKAPDLSRPVDLKTADLTEQDRSEDEVRVSGVSRQPSLQVDQDKKENMPEYNKMDTKDLKVLRLSLETLQHVWHQIDNKTANGLTIGENLEDFACTTTNTH
ncbi:hypothetical protein EDD86DRAFT_218163 [Gorgonomyces haynaldii]|nr:hypothetical protein EDD86DRAFT_218163 [Gorgonomyces haynaldii]